MRRALRDFAGFCIIILIIVVLRVVWGEKLWDMLEND